MEYKFNIGDMLYHKSNRNNYGQNFVVLAKGSIGYENGHTENLYLATWECNGQVCRGFVYESEMMLKEQKSQS